MFTRILLLTLTLTISWQTQASQQCETVKLGIVNWSDVKVTTAVAQALLESLNYEVDVSTHSVEGIYQHLSQNKLDAFLGNWMPTMAPIVKPYEAQNSIKTLGVNLEGAKYTLAVPAYVYEAGVKTFADLVRFKKNFDGRIYGLEKGNDGNLIIQKMIDTNKFGLGRFRLMATSENIMLAQVKKRIQENQWIAFLAWAPHPMNNQFDIQYLAGGDDFFGPNYGGSTVSTNVRTGLAKDCPNIQRLLSNLKFNLAMEASMMEQVINQFVPAKRAARNWMHNNPAQVETWLDGVTTRQGKPANAQAIAKNMKLRFSER
ncbi:MAG: choline ABC transporter substrate-binding protein [Bermanella sp.]